MNTATIIQFPVKKKVAKPVSAAAHYFCLKCDTDRFKILPNGIIHCWNCEALMRNIEAREVK